MVGSEADGKVFQVHGTAGLRKTSRGLERTRDCGFMVIDGAQVVVRPEDLPDGCELGVGKETQLWDGARKISKDEGKLSFFQLKERKRSDGRPNCWKVMRLLI